MALKRSLGPVQLVFYGVGTIVGAGIYSVIGAAAGIAGRGVWLSFVLASVAALLTALSYAELSAMLPRAGAEYQYLKRGFPRWRAIALAGGALIALNAAATSATVALAFAGYAGVFAGLPKLPTAIALLAACTALNIWGIRQSTWVGIALVCIEVGGLLLLIGTGLPRADLGAAIALPAWDDAAGIFAATALAFFVYIGFEDIANLGEESKQPKRDIPRALLASVVLTTALYLLVVWVTLGLVPPEELARSDSPLTLAGERVAPWLGRALAVAALFATASTALITLISISRLLFGMARDGDMPAILDRVLPHRKTPWVAALALFAMACALLPLGGVADTARVSSLGVLLVFAGIHVTLVVLRIREPSLARPFRVPLAIRGVPMPAVLGALCCLALITRFEAKTYGVVALVVVVAIVIHLVRRRRKH